jgi:hypothetical protein
MLDVHRARLRTPGSRSAADALASNPAVSSLRSSPVPAAPSLIQPFSGTKFLCGRRVKASDDMAGQVGIVERHPPQPLADAGRYFLWLLFDLSPRSLCYLVPVLLYDVAPSPHPITITITTTLPLIIDSDPRCVHGIFILSHFELNIFVR